MKLDDTMQPPGLLASGRFFRTGYLPTYAAAVFLLLLFWAGAPGRPIAFSRAWQAARHVSLVEVLLLALVVTLVAVMLQPMQLGIVRALEGRFPRWLGVGLARKVQIRRKRKLERTVTGLVQKAVDQRDDVASKHQRNLLVQQAGVASARLRSRFPAPEHLISATALGNALAATENTAGAAFGLDTVVIWPRLYPVLGDQVRTIIDDLRDGLDAAARLTATGVVTAMATAGLLAWHSGLRTLLALVPLAVASVAYLGAIQAALAYGGAVQVAFDLHRFDLMNALHIPVPGDQAEERANNIALSDFLRQGVPMPVTYARDPAK